MMFSSSSVEPVQSVLATVVSVGPYKLCNSTCGNRSWNCRTTHPGSASPPHITCLNVVLFPLSVASANSGSIEIGNPIAVTPLRWIVSHKYAASLCPSGRAITTRAPVINGQKNPVTDASNPMGAFCSTAPSSLIGYALCVQFSRFTTFWCSTITPLGAPDEPDV